MGLGLAGEGKEEIEPEAPTQQAILFLREQYRAANFTFRPATFATWLLMVKAPIWSAAAGEAAYGWVSSERYPSYGYMLAHNATTTWEHWNAGEIEISQNHAWLNSVVEFIRGHAVGLQLHPRSIGSDWIMVSPQPFGWRQLNDDWGHAPGDAPRPLTAASADRVTAVSRPVVAWRIEGKMNEEGEDEDENEGGTPMATREAEEVLRIIRRRAAGGVGESGTSPGEQVPAMRVVVALASLSPAVRHTVRVPLCKADPSAAARATASCLPYGTAGDFEAGPTPAVVFQVDGYGECELTAPWEC